jgi:hypothetical protein
MKLDPGMRIVMHFVFFGKTGVAAEHSSSHHVGRDEAH